MNPSINKKKRPTCYLAIGGNRGPTRLIFCQALILLKQINLFNLRVSRLYLTTPEQIASHQLFMNSCLSFETDLSPLALLDELQKIEKKLFKEKNKDGSRAIDLDLLFYGDLQLHTEKLLLPHPHWMERIFVLKPLSDLTHQIFLEVPFNIQALVLSLQKESSSFCEPITPGAFDELPFKTFVQRETCSHLWPLRVGGGRRGSLCSQFSL